MERSRQARLIGRERELAVVAERLRTAQQGGFAVVLLSGEAGVGKTRLLAEVRQKAAAGGWRVLVGEAFDSEGAPPYLPFIEALREYVASCPVEVLEQQLGDGAQHVALLVPDVSRRLPHLAVPEGEAERYRLFDSVADFIGAIARASDSGLLLCLDDLQWADDSTLLLFEHLCRRLGNAPVLVVGAYRDTDLDVARPLARTLEYLSRLHIAQRIDVKRLEVDGVRQMLAHLGRPEPPSGLVDAVYTETEGNPFFVQEVFEYLEDQGRLFDTNGLWRTDLRIGATEVPQSVRLVIGRRLERLTPECRAVLQLAAVLGRTLDFEVLRAMSDLPEEALVRALEDAERAQLVVSDERGGLTFVHELTRQTLISGVTAIRRQRLHLRAAEGIERMHGATTDLHLAELAGHYRAAGGAADPAKVVEYSTRAGERALDIGAYAESIRYFGDAMAALDEPRRPLANAGAMQNLHRKSGTAYTSLAKWPEARRHLAAALDLQLAEATADRAALLIDLAVACRWDGDLSNSRRHSEEARGISERLSRPDLHAGATAAMALVEFSEGDVAQGAASYRAAIERARDVDRGVSKAAEAGYAHLLYLSGRHGESVDHGLEGVRLARELGDMATLTFALGPLGLSLAATGRYQEAEDAFARARRVGSEYGIEGYLARAISMSATPRLDLFDFNGALELAQEAMELGQRFSFVPTRVSAGIDILFIHLRGGDVGRAMDTWPTVRASVLDIANGEGTWLHGWLWNLRLGQIAAEIALARGDWQDALSLAAASIETSRARSRPKYESAALITHAQALLALGRKKEALADLTAAVDVARLAADPATFVRTAAILLRVEPNGCVASDAHESVDRIRAALGNPQVRRCFDISEPVRLVTGLPRDDLGKAAYPDGLSQREVEVLRLVAAGMSNAQIADELVISVNTVQRHVGNILTKTGLANRTQAASYAHRAGVLTD